MTETKKKCIFIIPYFGKFKDSFPLFLRSCSYNESTTWLIITDNSRPGYLPHNVLWQYSNFENFRSLVQDKFNFKVSLERPYKLCDFKPCYGYVLEEKIKDFDYWGYCDLDLILGNLNEFIDPLMDAGYDKIFAAGHMTLYKNTEQVNRAFKLPNAAGLRLYKIALSNPQIFVFDEMYLKQNVHRIFLDNGFRVYDQDLSFNVSLDHYRIYRKSYIPSKNAWVNSDVCVKKICWRNGNLTTCYQGEVHEYLYVHLQSRAPAIDPRARKSAIMYVYSNAITIRPRLEIWSVLKLYRVKQYHILGHYVKQFFRRLRGDTNMHPENVDPYLNFARSSKEKENS